MTKKNVKKNTVFYYLQINSEIIIDFSYLPGFYNMEDYLKLNIFTGCFNNREELIESLKKLGLIHPDLNVFDIEIVRRKGNKKDGYYYKYITNTLVFKSCVPYLSIGTLKDFLQKNKNNYDLIIEVMEYYSDSLEKKVNSKIKSVGYLQSSINLLPDGEEKDELMDSLQKEKNSLQKFNEELVTLQRIIIIANQLKRNETLPRDVMLEYYNRLDRFVDNETLYVRGEKGTTQNNRGIVKMAKLFARMSKTYSEVIYPNFTRRHDDEQRELKKLLSGEPLSYIVHRTPVSAELDPEIDPDSYMFLESEDFERLRGYSSNEEINLSIDDAIANLEEKKGPKF